jgi:hypothetical protein
MIEKDSILGFASFAISLVCIGMDVLSALYWLVLVGSVPRWFGLATFILIGEALLASLFGVLLGCIALSQANRKKKLAKIGLLLNLFVIFGTDGFVCAGCLLAPLAGQG